MAEVSPDQALVQVEHLSFAWRKNAPALLQIESMRVMAGERVFIHGPSGCGKSSLLGLLGGVLQPQSGRIHLMGKELTRMSAGERERHRVDHSGFIFQQFNLIPYLNLIDNVLLPCQFSKRRAARASAHDGSARQAAQRLLAAVGLDESTLQRPVRELSVGQQQRVAAARALIGSPELVIADEPTSALDADAREAFVRLLFEECERAQSALLFVSHDAGLAERFDRRISLAQGLTQGLDAQTEGAGR
ncbi:ATP-binding cassette domain-containing protein [Roseateles sp.]|uniref:ATP-binding cassette domain-containing protein n=1 Tax=Roseateles sp. TaxID=1971397 RepID=UPI003BA527D1